MAGGKRYVAGVEGRVVRSLHHGNMIDTCEIPEVIAGGPMQRDCRMSPLWLPPLRRNKKRGKGGSRGLGLLWLACWPWVIPTVARSTAADYGRWGTDVVPEPDG